MRHWTAQEIKDACRHIGNYPDTFKQHMDVLEQRDLAILTLRRLADEENVNRAIASVSQFGSAGAGMAYGEVQKYAAETLAKMGVPSVNKVVTPITACVQLRECIDGRHGAECPAGGLCDAVLNGVRCKDPLNHGGLWHYGGAGMVWPR